MTSAMEAVTRLHPIRPPLASRAFVDHAWQGFLDARRKALTTQTDRDAIEAFAAYVAFQRHLADWQDGR